MSAVAAPSTMAGPWKKIAIWAAVFVAIVVVLFMFTGHFSFKSEKPKPQYKVQMNNSVSALDRPAQPLTPVTPAALPAPASPSAPLRWPATSSNDRQKGYDSDISAYVMTRNGEAAAKPGAGKPAADPDAIPESGQPGALEASLIPTKMDGTRVAELPNPRYLVEQGRQLPCTQQTKINSSLPGSVTAVIPVTIRGETGDTELIPKGARVFGTVQHGLMNGLDRLAVLWQNITTPIIYDRRGLPHQFRVTTNSPAASELGETGLDGDIDRHLLKKVGGIVGMSLIQGGIQAGVAAAQNNNGGQTFNFNQFAQGGNSAADMLLRSWISIPDILTRDQGLPCSIQLVRDLDLRGAYTLIQSIRNGS